MKQEATIQISSWLIILTSKLAGLWAKAVFHNSVTDSSFTMSLIVSLMSFIFQAIMNNISDNMNNIDNIINDKGSFPLPGQSWYRTALLKTDHLKYCGPLSL